MNNTQESELDLIKNRAKFVEEKQQLQIQIGEINQRCCTRIPNFEYRQLQQQRLILTRKVSNCEQWLTEIKGKIRVIQATKDLAKSQQSVAMAEPKFVLNQSMSDAYKKWRQFSEDESNPQSQRSQAALFLQEISKFQRLLNSF